MRYIYAMSHRISSQNHFSTCQKFPTDLIGFPSKPEANGCCSAAATVDAATSVPSRRSTIASGVKRVERAVDGRITAARCSRAVRSVSWGGGRICPLARDAICRPVCADDGNQMRSNRSRLERIVRRQASRSGSESFNQSLAKATALGENAG